jgi:Protein of unknown function (DUF1592)/Protein of unknown function (DUF1588)/Protein of unknown function (DUF1585)/Protein of unknown function (DUF1587)/Protein of unknown function (DUF1595)/Planctomycete cytochrome C
MNHRHILSLVGALAIMPVVGGARLDAADAMGRYVRPFFDQHCIECHDSETKKGHLDLTALALNLTNSETFATWVKIHDRVRAGEMPPEKKPRPSPKELDHAMSALARELAASDAARQQREGRVSLRRLNRVEFENTLRDVLAVPGLKVLKDLPADGKSHGFDRAADALEFSFVHMDTYLAAVDRALDLATPDFVERPPVFKYRYRPWDNHRMEGKECNLAFHISVQQRTCIGLVGMERDPTLKAVDGYRLEDAEPKSTALGFFRHEDADIYWALDAFPVLSGWHKLRVSGYSFGWDAAAAKVVPTERHGALTWEKSITGEHYGTVDLPPNKAAVSELTTWLERGGGSTGRDAIGFNPGSCEKIRDFGANKETGLGTFGPPCDAQGVAIEWFEIEGPFHDQWPPASQRALFGDLLVKAWTKESGVPMPAQQSWPKGGYSALKDIYEENGAKRPIVHVVSAEPEKDAGRLLASFLRRAFRRPVSDGDVVPYARIFFARMKAGEHFQDALKAAYRAALVSPDFFLLRGSGPHALAARLSYFLWAGPPDETLSQLADSGKLANPAVLRAQAERMLADPKAARFIESFTGQWLRLREIDATQPDKALYPEFRPWLQESMLAETRAFFTELLKDDLGVVNFVQSDFAMLNEPLARQYGIDRVLGFETRRVGLPKDSPRGGFLTQGAVLKVTANGTTTSPVKRGAFVMEQILGTLPTPPPADAGTIEPDTRGTTTIREQLEKHKRNATCAACHVKMDPYGFALESFDVVGQSRDRYRVGGAPNAPTGSAGRPFVNGNGIAYHFDKPVDCTGQLPDGRPFADVRELRTLLAANEEILARAFVGHLVTYATGAGVGFSDRREVNKIIQRAKAKKYGVRTLLLETVASPVFAQP